MAVTGKKLIVSTMKNEGPYILEWIAYHRAIGFTDFLIYTNDCTDGTDLLLDRLQSNGLVVHVRNKVLKRGPHKSALKYALADEHYQTADWVFVCDADEFLNIKVGEGHVEDLVSRFPEADAIPVAWRMFSNNGHVDLYPSMVTEAFTDAEPSGHEADTEGRFVKTIFRPSTAVQRLGLHGPVYFPEEDAKKKWGAVWLEKNPESDPRRPVCDFGYEIAQVNHYAVRSIDAFLMKRLRGRANHVNETLGLQYWNRWCRGGHSDTSINKHRKVMLEEYARISSDPVVSHLHLGAIEYQEQRLFELVDNCDIKKLRNELLALSSDRKNSNKVKPETTGTFAETEALKTKAPKRHMNRVRMLEQMPKNARCAEIGVWNGGFSGVILEVTEPSELILIDPWELLAEQDESEWTHKRHQDHKFMKDMRERVSRVYSDFPNVKIRNGFSQKVLSEFDDNYFDWLYVDGNHLYDFVRADLKLAFQKVRSGGIISGDDFFWKKDDRFHVKEAVLDEMRAQGMQNRPTRIGQQFMIKVP